ncbi:hypothetical protein BH09ACT12_BH09ACT12_12430 [soil metagenome]
MTDEQVRDVRALTRAAGIKPTTTRVDGAKHPLLAQLAPGDRVLVPGGLEIDVPDQTQRQRAPKSGNPSGGRRRGGNGGGGNGGGRSSAKQGSKPGAPKQGGGRRRTAPSTGAAGSHTAASFSSGRR